MTGKKREKRERHGAETISIPKDPNIASLSFKHEGSSHGMAHGSVWKNMRDGTSDNLVDSPQKDWEGKPFPEWFTYAQAEEIAEWLGVPLEDA